MSDSHDVAWHRDRRAEVMDLASVPDPEAVVPRPRKQQSALSNACFDPVVDVLQDDSMVQQPDALYEQEHLSEHGVAAERAGAPQGASFSDDVALGSDNFPFWGRLADGIERGTVDTQFLYTYGGDRAAPTNLVVRRHRGPGASLHWVLSWRL